MRVEKLSIRWLILLSLLLLFSTTLLLSYQSERDYQRAMKEREEDFLRRMVSVAVDQVYDDVHKQTAAFGSQFLSREEFKEAFSELCKEGDLDALNAVLEDPFVSGYVGATSLTLEALRVYDEQWRLVTSGRTASLMNIDEFPIGPEPSPVVQRAMGRLGADRFRAIGGRWATKQESYYSVVLPIGGLKIKGYLEVVVNSAINLPRIEQLIGIPIAITDLVNGRHIFSSSPPADQLPNYHQVHLDILSMHQVPVYGVTLFVSVADFEARLNQHKTEAMMMGSLINVAVLVLVLALLEVLLIRPMQRLRNDIHTQTRALTGDAVSTRGLSEFHDLSKDFNHLLQMVKQQQDSLEEKSFTDELTQVPNRRALEKFLREEQVRAKRCHDRLALLMIDIDHFKLYNDHYGHQQGDACLYQVAQVLKAALPRGTDFVGRYGGEEFSVVLPGTDLEGAGEVGERILKAIRDAQIPHSASLVTDHVTLSIGGAVCVNFEPGCIESLKQRADQSLYVAKKEGRNRVVLA